MSNLIENEWEEKVCRFHGHVVFRNMGFGYCKLTGTERTAGDCGTMMAINYKKCQRWQDKVEEEKPLDDVGWDGIK